MALEISEIGISMRVAGDDGEAPQRQPQPRQEGCRDVDREQLVDDCVRRVLRILKNVEDR